MGTLVSPSPSKGSGVRGRKLGLSPTPPRSRRPQQHQHQQAVYTRSPQGAGTGDGDGGGGYGDGDGDGLPQSEGFPRQWADVTYTQPSIERGTTHHQRDQDQDHHQQHYDHDNYDDEDEYGGNWTKIGLTGNTMAGFDGAAQGQGHGSPVHELRRPAGRAAVSTNDDGTKMGGMGDGLALMRNRVEQSAAQKHYKGLYKNMRHKDKLVDKDVDLDALEKRALKARSRWERFMSNDDERTEDKVRVRPSTNDVSSHTNNSNTPTPPTLAHCLRFPPPPSQEMLEEERIMEERFGGTEDATDIQALYSTMYARAVVVRQHWPWSMLVDLKTDKTFYRNEQVFSSHTSPSPSHSPSHSPSS